MFLTKFHRISSRFIEFQVHQNILSILKEKLGGKKFFYDEHKICSTDILAYYWLKQQIFNEKLGYKKDEPENLKEKYPELIKFVERMGKVLEVLHKTVSDIAKETETVDKIMKVDKPEELSHFDWKPELEILRSLEAFKQRNTVLLDGKKKYKRFDTYSSESRNARYW